MHVKLPHIYLSSVFPCNKSLQEYLSTAGGWVWVRTSCSLLESGLGLVFAASRIYCQCPNCWGCHCPLSEVTALSCCSGAAAFFLCWFRFFFGIFFPYSSLPPCPFSPPSFPEESPVPGTDFGGLWVMVAMLRVKTGKCGVGC